MVSKRRNRLSLAALLILVAALALPSLVYAGGWVVITLDRLPENVAAGQAFTLGLTARRHGRTPWHEDEIRIQAKQVSTGRTETFIAAPDQQPGHYQVELLFPEPGRWEWGVASGLFPSLQPLPAIQVAGASDSNQPARSQSLSLGLPPAPVPLLGFFALLAVAAGTLILLRGRNRRAFLLAGIGSLLLLGGLAAALFTYRTVRAQNAQLSPQTAAGPTAGQQLFLAKGCVVCHVNSRALKGAEEYSVNVGPNLTNYHADPAFLRRFLAAPAAVRSSSLMPDLGLSAAEIDALVTFINSSSPD